MFDESTHNEKIKHVYGNYNFWSWFRYWYLDSVNYVTFLLLDKGYFDYDYEKTEREDIVRWEDTVRSDDEIREIMAGFGIGVQRKKKPETLEEIQNYIIKQESYGS